MVAGLTYVWSVGGTDRLDFVTSEFRVLSFAVNAPTTSSLPTPAQTTSTTSPCRLQSRTTGSR